MSPPQRVRSADSAALAAAMAPGAVLCTLVGIDGGFSRRLGAQLTVAADGTLTGSLSDGCLEAELARQAEVARGEGRVLHRRYGAGSAFIDFRLPCGAGVDLLIDPRPDHAAIAGVLAALARRESAELSVGPGADGLTIDFLPRLRIVAMGAGPELTALGRLATAFGAEYATFAPAGGLSSARQCEAIAIDPWTAIACLFHDHEWERIVLPWALDTPALLVGAIGGSKTRDQRSRMLAAAGVNPDTAARLRAPLGLLPRTRDPATLALAALAEIVRDYEALIGPGSAP